MADLHHLINLTENMLAEAFNGQWSTVIELQTARQRLLHDRLLNDLPFPQAEIEAGVQKILALDHQLLELAVEQKELIKQELTVIRKGKNRVKAYAPR